MPLAGRQLPCLRLPPPQPGLAPPFSRDRHPHRLNEHAAALPPPCLRSQLRSWLEPIPTPATFSTFLSRSPWRLAWENSTPPPRHSSSARCFATYTMTTGRLLMDSLRTSLPCLRNWRRFALPLSLPPLLLHPLPLPPKPLSLPHGQPPSNTLLPPQRLLLFLPHHGQQWRGRAGRRPQHHRSLARRRPPPLPRLKPLPLGRALR